MAITYQPVAGEAPTIDPDDARGPWTINLPDTSVNGYAVTLKIWPRGVAPITVTALGAGATVEDPTQPGTSSQSIQFSTTGVSAIQYIYNQGLNVWGIYGGGAFTQRGRGAMSTTPQAISDLGAGWNPVLFDTEEQPPHGMLLDTATGQFTLVWQGWWEFRYQVNLTHNEVNDGRETFVRLFNTTDAAPVSAGFPIYVGRNVGGFSANISLRFLVDATQLNDVFRLEIGGGDSFTSVVLDTNSIDFTQTTSSTL